LYNAKTIVLGCSKYENTEFNTEQINETLLTAVLIFSGGTYMGGREI
jgi:hypothetical protein